MPLKYWKKKHQLRILYTAKISFKYEGKIMTFTETKAEVINQWYLFLKDIKESSSDKRKWYQIEIWI